MTAAPEPPGDEVLVLAGVGVRHGATWALQDVDWRVRPGERWVVLGPNGSGKTTLVRLASGLVHPTTGTVDLLGRRVGRTDLRALRTRVALASAALASSLRPGLTAREAVMTARHGALEPWWHEYGDDDRSRADALLARLGAGALADRAIGTLSEGERQRVLLARTLVTDPGLIVLDEPTAGLDLGGREELVARLAQLAADPASPPIVFVTHHVDEVPPGFTHLLLVRGGRIHAAGPLAETLTAAALSSCFGLPLQLARHGERWSAWAELAPAGDPGATALRNRPGARPADADRPTRGEGRRMPASATFLRDVVSLGPPTTGPLCSGIAMAYSLGVDLGTTYTAAAVRRDDRSEIVALQHSESVIPSVVFFGEDGAIVTGEPANQRALSRPERVAREFKRRTGDPTPLLVAGRDHTVESLTADMLRWVIRAVAQQQGALPNSIALCHPANWGPHKVEALSAAARLARVNVARFISEPEAAAIHYSTQERVEPGTVVAVYDLGGGTFDATVLRKDTVGFELLGLPRGVDQLGGIDFDELVFRHVIQSVGSAFAELDPDDPLAMSAVSRLRRECVKAKEFLSSDTVALIPVLLPDAQAEVRLTRTEFEAMIRPLLAQSIDALSAALQAAQVQPADVDVVLLVGGSSRIPLVSQLVQSSLGRPVAIDIHTKHAVALGASVAAELSGFSGRVSDDPHLVEAAEAAYLGKAPPLPYSDGDDRAAAGGRAPTAVAQAAPPQEPVPSPAATSYPPGPPTPDPLPPPPPDAPVDHGGEGADEAGRKRFWRRKR